LPQPALFPTWESLVHLAESILPPGHPSLRILRLREDRFRRRVHPAFRAIVRLANLWMRNDGYERLLHADWAELAELYAEQVIRSAAFEETAASMAPADLRAAGSDAEGKTMGRRFHQLPCIQANLRDRVRLIRELCDRRAPVLLAGDDDLLSVELARDGFTDVTAIDIDPRVLAQVEAAAHVNAVKVRTALHDLSKTPAPSLIRSYGLLIMDPTCTPEGLRLFLGASGNCVGRPGRPDDAYSAPAPRRRAPMADSMVARTPGVGAPRQDTPNHRLLHSKPLLLGFCWFRGTHTTSRRPSFLWGRCD
jgi:hypothetical protein